MNQIQLLAQLLAAGLVQGLVELTLSFGIGGQIGVEELLGVPVRGLSESCTNHGI